MTTEYLQKLVALAKEIHGLQIEESDKLQNVAQRKTVSEGIQTDWETVRINSKINYLIGYIEALEGDTAIMREIKFVGNVGGDPNNPFPLKRV